MVNVSSVAGQEDARLYSPMAFAWSADKNALYFLTTSCCSSPAVAKRSLVFASMVICCCLAQRSTSAILSAVSG
jgi:hypothetical protein